MLHLESKEKETAAISETYQKNGARCVDRIRARFAKERRELSTTLQHDGMEFLRILGLAKRTLRDGARDRHRALKDIDRNAQKRRKGDESEVVRLNALAKRFAKEN